METNKTEHTITDNTTTLQEDNIESNTSDNLKDDPQRQQLRELAFRLMDSTQRDENDVESEEAFEKKLFDFEEACKKRFHNNFSDQKHKVKKNKPNK
jgi:hypothetical protein